MDTDHVDILDRNTDRSGKAEGVSEQESARTDLEASAAKLSAMAAKAAAPPEFSEALLSRYTWDEIDAGSAHLLEALDPESQRIYRRLGRLPGAERHDLGTFRVDPHTTVTFEVIPELGEVAYSEVSEYPKARQTPQEDLAAADDKRETASPLLRFLEVTDGNVAVPRMLEEFDDSADAPETMKALAERDVIDTLDGLGTPADVGADLAAAQAEAGAVWTCGSGGSSLFANTYCQNIGKSYCDNGGWLDLTRTSGTSRRKISHSRIATCGSSGTYIEHQFRYWKWTEAKWKWTAVKYPIGPAAWWQIVMPGQVKYWKHVSGRKRRRKVRAWTHNQSWFRSWTAFYN